MSIDGYLQAAIARTRFDDHGLVVWHSGDSGPLVNEGGHGTLEAVLLWKAVPDPGQEDSEYPSGTMAFRRQNIDTDFSEPLHVQTCLSGCLSHRREVGSVGGHLSARRVGCLMPGRLSQLSKLSDGCGELRDGGQKC